MRRHPALEPFSRDHNTGLILARALMEERPNAADQFREAWDRELADHFAEEERLLGHLASEGQRARLIEEHQEIEGLMGGLPESIVALGEALDAHIRWEERFFFPAIEASASEEQLVALMRDTDVVEERRWEHEPNRERLVRRRREQR